ncbi:MAG: serine/threonine protein kinase [Labilithrix sp.]|nr:serine/threonine protein kinase [Labilithrix sp.]
MIGSREFKGRSGQIVAGRYELLEMIGSGLQSVVYKAHDRVENDYVALKVSEWSDPDASERMFREAFVMCQLQNTAAVRVLHQCETDDGATALVMELLHGADLGSILHLREGRGEKASRSWLTALLEPIVFTLDAAHKNGIVHRDLKAENVFVIDPRAGGGVRLLDFGFAKLTRSPKITSPEAFAGSPGYIAPEVWRRGAWRADARADVYAFGVLAFRILAGRMPFEGSPIELARKATTEPRPSLHALRPDLPADLDAWVGQVLAVEVDERFANINAAWRALQGCLEGD